VENTFLATLWSYLQFVPFALEIFLLLWGANKVYDLVYGRSDVIVLNHLATAIQRAGLSLGCVLAMVSAMDRVRFEGFGSTVVLVAVWGAVATLSVIVASFVNDKFITRGINDQVEVRKGNVPVAIVDASAAFATGLITAGSFSGGAPWWVVGIFFVIGQFVLVLSARLYITYAELEEKWLMQGNLAAALSLGGMLIATGIVLRNVLSGPYENLVRDVMGTLTGYGIGMALLFGAVVFVPRLYFGQGIHGAVRSNNVAVAFFIAIMKVLLALTIGFIVIT
jgi:uncharacterized membrane protein YjfL (UPF0719 family)